MLKDTSNNEYAKSLVSSQDDTQTANLMSSLVTLIGVTTSKQVLQWLDRYHASDKMRGLREVTLYELTHEAKISSARAEIVLAAIRLGKAAWLPSTAKLTYIESTDEASKLFLEHLSHLEQEKIMIACLDYKNRLLHLETIGIGTHNTCLCDVKVIFRTLLKSGATKYLIAHNHPSGFSAPSTDDLELTRVLLRASQDMCIGLLDHLVIGDGTFTSIRGTTSLWDEYPNIDDMF